MKSILNILIVLVFGAASIGIPIHKHLCHGKVVGVGITEKSCFEGEEKESDCCENESSVVGLEDEVFLSEKKVALDFQPVFELPGPIFAFPFQQKVAVKTTAPNCSQNKAPPKKLYLLYSQRTFYC